MDRPGGGLIAALAISPSNPSIVYAGSWGGGLYRSPDGGGTWAWKSQGLLNQTVVSIAVDPTDPNIAYAGTYRGKVFKTADGANPGPSPARASRSRRSSTPP